MAWLPDRLPTVKAIRWQKRLTNRGLAGVAANDSVVVVADRDPADTMDVFRCLSAADGTERWTARILSPGELDYGGSSRATPLIHGGLVIVLGAQGQLSAIDLVTGKIRWKKDFKRDFGSGDDEADAPADGEGATGAVGGVKHFLPWGYCASPLIADDKLIVSPGGADASIVALKPSTGDVVWKSPGRLPGYGSMIAATLGGKRQIVGADNVSFGGWDLSTGRRLWTLTPKRRGGFYVPTPIDWRGQLILATEISGTNIHAFDTSGKVAAESTAVHEELSPDSHTPVVLSGGKDGALKNDRLLGVWNGLHCLDLNDKLKPIWRSDDRVFQEYASIIASSDRYLITTVRGELILGDATAKEYRPMARLKLFTDDEAVFSHPALVGTRLFVRGSSALVCLELLPSKQISP